MTSPAPTKGAAGADGKSLATGTAFHGPTTRVRVALADGTGVKADVPTHAAAALTPGTAVTVRPRQRPVMLAGATGGAR